MKEVTGNIWTYYNQGHWIVITTNSTIKTNGECVMGRGIALQVKKKFPEFPRVLAKHIEAFGNVPIKYHIRQLITFPTKHNWWEKSDIQLIEESCKALVEIVTVSKIEEVYMVRPGCSNGGLEWSNVKLVIEPYLDDRFTIVER